MCLIDYIIQLGSKDVFDIMLNELPPVPAVKEEELPPRVDPQPCLAMLDGPTVLHLTSEAHLTSVKVIPSVVCLNYSTVKLISQELLLHNHHLSRFRLASSLPQLHKLVLSFNELTTADDFCNMVLTCMTKGMLIGGGIAEVAK